MVNPLEHTRLKEECRKKGVEIYSIFTFNHENYREASTVKDIIFISSLSADEVLFIAVGYFEKLGYVGKVSLRHIQGKVYKAVLSKRLKY